MESAYLRTDRCTVTNNYLAPATAIIVVIVVTPSDKATCSLPWACVSVVIVTVGNTITIRITHTIIIGCLLRLLLWWWLLLRCISSQRPISYDTTRRNRLNHLIAICCRRKEER